MKWTPCRSLPGRSWGLPRKCYIIASTPRSGSNLLAGGLTATAVAGYPTERFPRPDALTAEQRKTLTTPVPPEGFYDLEQDARYIRDIIESGTTLNGVFGIKMHWFQVHDAARRLQGYLNSRDTTVAALFAAAFPNLSYIWLRRRDKVAQAVSLYEATRTGRYVKLRNAAEPDCRPSGAASFDYPRILTYWSALKRWEESWENYFRENDLTPLTIFYDELSDAYESTIRKVLGFLEVDHRKITVGEPPCERTANPRSAEWIARFNALQTASHANPPC